MTTGDWAMVVVYWSLTVFWLGVVSLAVASIVFNPVFREETFTRHIAVAFLVLAIIFFLDSWYWSIASTARVGLLSESIRAFLYQGWAVAIIKGCLLIAALIFGATFLIIFHRMRRVVETLYFTRFADQAVDAIGVLGKTGVVKYWNKGAEQLYLQPREDVIGKHIKEFLVPSRLHGDINDILQKIKITRKPVRFIAPRLRRDEREIMAEITITPMIDEANDFVGYFGVMREVNGKLTKGSERTDTKETENPLVKIPESLTPIEQRDTIFEIADALRKSHEKEQRRKQLALVAALALLLVICILMSVALIVPDAPKILFGSGSVLAALLEILPIRTLAKQQNADFGEQAIRKILDTPGMDREKLNEALELFDSVRARLFPAEGKSIDKNITE